jgi:NADPH:quinone reductase-like Zn-dependent oxidoreductase
MFWGWGCRRHRGSHWKGCFLFKPGDAVYYAGDVTRPGCDSEYHLVDERIVGRKPKSLDFAQAAAMPLTSITPGNRSTTA